jgi:hypothetical protein
MIKDVICKPAREHCQQKHDAPFEVKAAYKDLNERVGLKTTVKESLVHGSLITRSFIDRKVRNSHNALPAKLNRLQKMTWFWQAEGDDP